MALRVFVLVAVGAVVGLLVAGTAFPGGRDPVDRCPRAGSSLRAEREPWAARIACTSVVGDRRRTTHVAASAADWAWLLGVAAAGGVVGLVAAGALARRRMTA